jgi:hypothetical protein
VHPTEGLDAAERSRLERLAVAGWSAAAGAHVDSVVVLGGRAAVNLLLNGHYAYAVYFQRDDTGKWDDAGSSSGHADVAQLAYLDDD